MRPSSHGCAQSDRQRLEHELTHFIGETSRLNDLYNTTLERVRTQRGRQHYKHATNGMQHYKHATNGHAT
jgi:hypothetical protein